MPRFFAERVDNGVAFLSKEEAHHAVDVMRLRAGDALQVIREGLIYEGTLISETEGTVRVGEPLPSREPTVSVTLYQGLPKGDKMDLICQKCTEAGITRVVPVLMERCVAKTDAKDAEKKRLRWQRIAEEAAKQSGRAVVPEITLPVTVKQLAERLSGHELALVPWEEARGQSVRTAWQGHRDVAVVIGPEGGISPKEIALMASAVPVTLGPRIFRTETAGLAALIEIMCLSGNME